MGRSVWLPPFDGLPLLIPVPQAAKLLRRPSRAAAYRFASAGDLPTQAARPERVYVVSARLRQFMDAGGRGGMKGHVSKRGPEVGLLVRRGSARDTAKS